MLTKKHFTTAAHLIRAIREGRWTNDAPGWIDVDKRYRDEHDTCRDEYYDGYPYSSERAARYTRAVHTAEFFVFLEQADHNPRFDRERFLVACGLREEERR